MIYFDNSPVVYWFIGYLLAVVVIVLAWYKKAPALFFLFASYVLLAFKRLPSIVFNRELNPDESQMISEAFTLYQDPVYWRSVDGTTIGPLDTYLLVLPKLLGFQLDYTTIRVVGLLCTAGALLLLFLAIRNWFGSVTARIAILLPLLFLCFTEDSDFIHCSSEQLPIFLLALALWLLSKLSGEITILKIKIHSFFIGFVAGTIPFAKLQAVPQTMIIVLCAFLICYQLFRKTKNYFPLLLLLVGGVTFPALVFTWAISQNVFSDLIDFYLKGNLIYAGENVGLIAIVTNFFKITTSSTDFTAFCMVLIVPMLVGIKTIVSDIIKRSTKQGNLVVSLSILGLILAGIYAVTKTGNNFTHYLNFCVGPFVVLAAYGLKRFGLSGIIFPPLLLAWFGFNDARSYLNERRLTHFASENATQLPQSPIVTALRKYTTSKDHMVVWGWQCAYYVEAQLAQGTAENHSERCIFKHAMLETYRNRYIEDIKRTKPVAFLDAVGKNSLWVQDKKTQSFENFPALASYISLHYSFAGNFDDSRLYIRKDRF